MTCQRCNTHHLQYATKVDLNLFTPTTSHPLPWCLLHISCYRTGNSGPLSTHFKTHATHNQESLFLPFSCKSRLSCAAVTAVQAQHLLCSDSQTVSVHHMLPGCSLLCQMQPDQFPSEHNLNRQNDFRAECLLCSWQSMRILTDGFSNTGEKMP